MILKRLQRECSLFVVQFKRLYIKGYKNLKDNSSDKKMGNLCNLTKALWMSPQLPNQKWYLSFQIEERYHPSFWDDKSTSEIWKSDTTDYSYLGVQYREL